MNILQVIYEDQDILAVNKSAGIIVNRSDTTKSVTTLQDLVEQYLHIPRNQKRLITKRIEGEWEMPEDAFVNRSGIVHRLDKETSGVILIAKNLESFVELQRQFKERETEKTYLALAHGKIFPEEGEISVPVGRLTFNRKRFGVVANGRESVTRYKVLRYYKESTRKEDLTFVELYPKTGRTHQIRVHLQYIGHPIFSDELYAGRKVAKSDRKILPRIFLHAAKLSFNLPSTGKRITLEAPLQSELHDFLKMLENIG